MIDNIRFESGAIRPSECLSEGWNMIKDNYGLFLGISLLGMVIGGCIPCVSFFLAGPIAVGIFYCLQRQYRREQVEFGMMFKGFEVIVPAMVVGIIQSIPEIIAQIFRLTVNVGDALIKTRGGSSNFLQSGDTALAGGIVIIAIVVGLGFLILGIAWRISFFFALPLLAEYPELGIADVIKLSFRAGWANWGMIFVLGILQGLAALVGVLALCIGILFVMPIIQASNIMAYRMVFPPRESNNPNLPPMPDFFGGNVGTAA